MSQHTGRFATVLVRECSQSTSGFCNKAAPGAGTAAPALFFNPGAGRYFGFSFIDRLCTRSLFFSPSTTSLS